MNIFRFFSTVAVIASADVADDAEYYVTGNCTELGNLTATGYGVPLTPTVNSGDSQCARVRLTAGRVCQMYSGEATLPFALRIGVEALQVIGSHYFFPQQEPAVLVADGVIPGTAAGSAEDMTMAFVMDATFS